jgi:hypothetical protein
MDSYSALVVLSEGWTNAVIYIRHRRPTRVRLEDFARADLATAAINDIFINLHIYLIEYAWVSCELLLILYGRIE